jgi:hypothetical protein
MTAVKICFFIAPIGEEGSEDRDRSDQVRDYIVRPIAEKFGYQVIRADEISKSGIITSQVIEYLFESPLVVAYLATGNPNVFYELALRHAVRKPFVQVIEEGQKIPFDVSALRTIQLKYGDFRSLAECKSELSKQIESLEKNPNEVDSPVSQAIDVKALRDSNKPIEQGLARVMEMIEALRGQIAATRPAMPQINMPQIGLIPRSAADAMHLVDAAVIQPINLSALVNPSFLTKALAESRRVLAEGSAVPKVPDASVKPTPMNPTKKGQK